MRKKITIVGAGNVGATAAHWIMAKELADVVLIDVVEGIPQGKALDLQQAQPIERSDVHVMGTNDYADTAHSDVVIITAGIPRKPGMSRDDLLQTNFKIMSDVVSKVVKYSPESILIVVSPWCRQLSVSPVSTASGFWAWPASSTPAVSRASLPPN
jgi:malate dehydrogenase